MYYIAEYTGMSRGAFSNVLAPTVVRRSLLAHPSRDIFIECTMHKQQAQATKYVADLKCAASLCTCHFHTVKELVSNLKDHIGEGRPVPCPVRDCKHVFTKKVVFYLSHV